MPDEPPARELIRAARQLARAAARLRFGEPIVHTYNPLQYGWRAHETYLQRYGAGRKRVIFVGMNPGPFGMAQTGIPFGEIAAVRDWLGISSGVTPPRVQHPKRPITGFACPRSEVSGNRLWGLFAQRYGSPDRFFAEHFVVNYCPLIFLEHTGKNRTPDQLTAVESAALVRVCDRHLRRVIEILDPEWVIGVGGFALRRIQSLPMGAHRRLGQILHPSPANPAANRGWAAAAARELVRLGVWKE